MPTDDLLRVSASYADETRVRKIFSIREEETDELVRMPAKSQLQRSKVSVRRVYSSNGQRLTVKELSNEETLLSKAQIVKVGTLH